MFHTDFRKGQTIFVLFRDGRKEVHKYKEAKNKYLITSKEKIPFRTIRQVLINRLIAK